MRREPSLTLRGALAILGHHNPRLINKLDKILGGVILGAGAGGLAAMGNPALAPLATFAAAWGWIDQKNEALGLLEKALNTVSDKIMNTAGYERRQLIAAAHTTIVVAAFFDSLREQICDQLPKDLQITDVEKERLVTGNAHPPGQRIFDLLYTAQLPAPSASVGFFGNIPSVRYWYGDLTDRVGQFLGGLQTHQKIEADWSIIIESAVERYTSYYLRLAAKVPEFMIWALLGEHEATRSTVSRARDEIIAALDADRRALGLVESLLKLTSLSTDDRTDLRSVVERANRGVLDQPIVPMDAERYGTTVTYPAIGSIYINPHYRIASAEYLTRAADEKWWDRWPVRDDLDFALTAYITGPNSTTLPMMLLGHPGAGKSMLTKVLAARLPASAYTVIRVPLRQVSANAPILDQIQQALDLATHKRVDWWRLVEESRMTTRVVLLDGLDELLQATSNDRSSYLHEVMDFQRLEAEQDRPVVIIVTSRTVVADRVEIPDGTTLVKLDYFDGQQIEEWLARWHETNARGIASGTFRELTVGAIRGQAELARQPLLLLMLALYSADPAFPALDAGLSTAELYRGLFDNFARREVAKKSRQRLSPDEIQRQVDDQLDRLSIAALAMFNRGQQAITETEVGEDLLALSSGTLVRSRPIDLGQRLIGEFFFVHAAEARPLGGKEQIDDAASTMVAHERKTRRSYEFLHATFGEYLVASRVLNELVDVAETALAGRRGPRDPDDDMLFAMLSHFPLAVRRSTLGFAAELFAILREDERHHVLQILDILIESYRRRHGSDRYVGYQPVPIDRLRQLGAYSANLVALRVALKSDDLGVPLDQLMPHSSDALQEWRSTVMLWRSALDADGMQAMLTTFTFSGTSIQFAGHNNAMPESFTDLLLARLSNDDYLETLLRYGRAVNDIIYLGESNLWAQLAIGNILAPLLGVAVYDISIPPPPPETGVKIIRRVAELLMRVLRTPGRSFQMG